MSEEKTVDKNNWLQNVVSSLNVYEFEEKLPGSKRLIKFKPITTSQLKIFLQNENEKNQEKIEQIIDKIICESVVSEDFNIDELYLQDRVFLFFCIRIRSKGNNIELNKRCKKCNSQYVSLINLTKIDYKELNEDVDYKIMLDKKSFIEMKYLKRKDLRDILNYEKTIKCKNETEKQLNLTFLSYAASIKSITFEGKTNENLTLDEKFYFLNNVAESILAKITKWLSDNDFGISLEFDDVCPHCGRVEKIEVKTEDVM